MNPPKKSLFDATETFARSVTLPVPAAVAFAWHEQPGALEALTPPWERIRLVSMTDGIRDGSRVTIRARVGFAGFGVWTTWMMEHYGYVPGAEFNDRMLRGPFPLWEHRHGFADKDDGTCVMTDEIRYKIPFGAVGRLAAGRFTRRKLEKLFAWRHAVTRASVG